MYKDYTVIFSQLLITVISTSCCYLSTFSQSYAVITGKIINVRQDSLSFIYSAGMVKVPLLNDSFFLKLKVSVPSNIDITDGVEYISGLIEPKDSINIKADFGRDKMSPEFEGRGKGKFIYIHRRTSLFPLINERIVIAKLQKNPIDYLLAVIDSAENSFTQELNGYKTEISKDAYSIFLGDLKGHLWQVRSSIPSLLYKEPFEKLLKRNSESISIKFKQQFKSFLNFKESYSHSAIYVLTVARVMEAIYKSNNLNRLNDIEYKYKYISQRLPSKLRVPVISRLLTEDIKARQDKNALEKVITETFRKAIDSTDKAYFIQRLNDIFQLKEGQQATDFILENKKGEKVRLSDFKGKVIYMDFWFADCQPCHQLFKQIKSVKENFKNNSNVVFLNISIDNKEVWQKALYKFNIEGYHVFTEGKEATHPIIGNYQVFGYPTNRLLDREGKFFIVAPSDKAEELIKEINAALKK